MIDFTENGNSEQGNPLMEANPGGAPCNMLAMIQKLGGTTAFIGKVGKDMFGRQLKTAVEAVGIDTRNLMEDVYKRQVIESSKVFHFGTLSFTHEEVKEATKFAVKGAKEAGIHISFDPNLREPLWKNLEDAKKAMAYGFQNCDILKIADNELQFFTGEEDFDQAVSILQENYKIPLICVTLGKDGSRAYYKRCV